MIRIALGTAHRLGLKKIKIDKKSLPTTAHFMTVGQCLYDCGFCSQAKSSQQSHQYLSRVTWPIFKKEKIKDILKDKLDKNFKRVCLQVIQSSDYFKQTIEFIDYLKPLSRLPLSVSIRPKNLKEIKQLFDKKIDRIGLAVDLVDENDYQKIKGGSQQNFLDSLLKTSKQFPGKITTHLIIGFSETEKQVIELIQKLNKNKISVGLFAFTPIPGTQLEKKKPPNMGKYRRIQLAYFLISNNLKHNFKFDKNKRLISAGFSKNKLLKNFKNTSLFQTTGCPFCNRPYYNESPREKLYNYPYKPSEEEFKKAVDDLGDIC